MNKTVFFVLAALCACALAGGKIQLNWPCTFHVDMVINNVYGHRDVWGMWNLTKISYLREDVYTQQAEGDYRRILRYDTFNGRSCLWVRNMSGNRCAEGFDYIYDYDYFVREWEYSADPETVPCPDGANVCTKYTEYWGNYLILDSENRLVYISNGAKTLTWFNDTKETLSSKDFVLHMCSGATFDAPGMCGSASIAAVAKAVLALALLVALLF